MSAKIKVVAENSLAAEMEIEAGDLLISINGFIINDIIDFQFYSQDDYLEIEIEKPNQEIWEIELEKDFDEELGIELEGVVFDKMRVCKNRCIFCFIDQLPNKMRKSLYIKDDDYRYSFMYGNFITLTNLKEADWQKIISMRLSPLYVSVHSMQPDIRMNMLNNPQAKSIREDLTRLQDAGIEVHTQIVLCPGVNDGEILLDSLEQLASFYPSVISVGIVPVGLTGHRDGLSELRTFTAAECIEIIAQVDELQLKFRQKYDLGLVYLADEFFIKAGINFPPAVYYDDYIQIENGIGLARILLDEFAEIIDELPAEIDARQVYVVTGYSALSVLEPIMVRLNDIKGLEVELIPITNEFFGGNVSVTGLLTGHDIINSLGKKYAGKIVILPEIIFKEGELVLLDDISLEDIKNATGAVIHTVDGSAWSLVNTILFAQGDGSFVRKHVEEL